MSTPIIIVIVLAVIAVIAYLAIQWWNQNKDDKVHRLPMPFDLLPNMPAIPLILKEIPGTLLKLSGRDKEVQPAKKGLSNTYTIDGETHTGFAYLYGEDDNKAQSAETARTKLRHLVEKSSVLTFIATNVLGKYFDQKDAEDDEPEIDPLTVLSLEKPAQFEMSWTTFDGVYDKAQPFADTWIKTLTDAQVATEQFWPTIAQYGLAYNLLIAKKINSDRFQSIKNQFGSDATEEMESLAAQGQLYAIDMTIFSSMDSVTVDGIPRFTPSTLTLLKQDPVSKNLEPFAIWVSGEDGANKTVYDRSTASPAAWLYALQAAKVSITVYGIWLGHVYHWHIVTAAMQMSLYNRVPETHFLYKVLHPQSNYLIAFDDVLLLLWRHTAPPTAIATSKHFLRLINNFADGRNFFDDDPKTTLANLGITEADFTVNEPWDKFIIVKHLLRIWDAVEAYVTTLVNTSYKDDAAVSADKVLQSWIADAGNHDEGNIKGLPAMDSRAALIKVLNSLIYRVTAHGISRQSDAANPALTFVANFPPTFHKTDIPATNTNMTTEELLKYMPNTGTIGKMINFYFTFVFSTPYESFIPADGVDAQLFYPGGKTAPMNEALIKLREAVAGFIKDYSTGEPQMEQWPLNIET